LQAFAQAGAWVKENNASTMGACYQRICLVGKAVIKRPAFETEFCTVIVCTNQEFLSVARFTQAENKIEVKTFQ